VRKQSPVDPIIVISVVSIILFIIGIAINAWASHVNPKGILHSISQIVIVISVAGIVLSAVLIFFTGGCKKPDQKGIQSPGSRARFRKVG